MVSLSLVSQTTSLFYFQVGYWGWCKRLHCVQTLWLKGPGLTAGFPMVSVHAFSVAQVLQQTPSPAGPMLHLSPTFASQDNQEKLEQFIQQFICG